MKTAARGYLFVQGMSVVLDVLRNVVVAALLGPANMGFCLTLLVVPQLAQYLNLGLNESLTVVVPRDRALKNHIQAEQTKDVVFSATFWISVVSFLLVAMYATFFRPGHTQSNYFLILAGFLIVLWEIRQFFVMNYTAEKQLNYLSSIELMFSILVAVMQIGLIYYLSHSRFTGYTGYGFWFGFILPNLIIIFWAGAKYTRGHRLRLFVLNFPECRKLVPLGIGLLIASVAYAPFLILARIYLAYEVGMEEVGFFLLSIAVITKLSIIPASIARILTPRVSFDYYEEEGNCNKVFRLFRQAQVYTILLSLAVILLGSILIEPFVRWLLPTYAVGIPAAKVMLLAMIPYCLIDNANNVLLVLKEKRVYFFSLLAALIFSVLLNTYLSLIGGLSALSMSFVFLITFSVYAFLTNFAVIRRCISEARLMATGSC